MDLQAQIIAAVREELRRQAEVSDGRLIVSEVTGSSLRVDGVVELDALAMVIAGSLAGGP